MLGLRAFTNLLNLEPRSSQDTLLSMGNHQLSFNEFCEINSESTGIIVKQVGHLLSFEQLQDIKDCYPLSLQERRGKMPVFVSQPDSGAEMYFESHPGVASFYNSKLQEICNFMRQEILATIPESERRSWEENKWGAAVQWSDGGEPLFYDHRQHVHRDMIVASLTFEGSGTIAKIPHQDISQLDFRDIYDRADAMPGFTYQADEGVLMILNGVHYPSGGLHAAPQSDGAYPQRLTVLVEIFKSEIVPPSL